MWIFHLSVNRRRTVELAVIKSIESLDAEFKRFGFAERDVLLNGQIEVLDARAVEDAAFSVSELAEGFLRKGSGAESRLAVAAVRVDVERARKMLRSIQ